MTLYPFKGKKPRIEPGVYIDPYARVVGDVEITSPSFVFFGSIVKGEEKTCKIESRVVILENCVIEDCEIGEGTFIGPCCVLKGCKVGNYVYIAPGSVVLEGAEIGDGAVLMPSSTLLRGVKVGKEEVVGGVPARHIRKVKPEDKEFIKREFEKAVKKAEEYREVFTASYMV